MGGGAVTQFLEVSLHRLRGDGPCLGLKSSWESNMRKRREA